MIENQKLIKTDDYITFLIDIDNSSEYSMGFKVSMVTSWTVDTSEPIDKELYAVGNIKWDGCSNWTFGEDQDGYMHFCGKEHIKQFNEMMIAVFELAAKTIKNYDKQCAEV